MMELSAHRNRIRAGWLGLGAALVALALPLAGLGQATNPNRVREVSTFPGATQDAQIASCFADLPSTGGICDARSLPGTQTWARNPFVSLTKPVTLLLGPAIITTVTFGPPPGFGLVRLIGSGPNQTIFTTSSTSAPILQCPQSGESADADYFEGFSVKSPPSNSSANAIDLSGCRTSTFKDISYLSNRQSNFSSFIHLAASPGHCYGNRIVHYMVQTQTGPETVILFDNGGTSQPLKNANENYLIGAWIYGNRGITTIIDARRSALTIIRDGLFEANPGATVLIPGTLTSMSGVWIEKDAPISVLGQSGIDGSSNAVSLINNYISAGQTFEIQPGGRNWTIEGNWPDAALTVTDKNGGSSTSLVRSGATVRSPSK